MLTLTEGKKTFTRREYIAGTAAIAAAAIGGAAWWYYGRPPPQPLPTPTLTATTLATTATTPSETVLVAAWPLDPAGLNSHTGSVYGFKGILINAYDKLVDFAVKPLKDNLGNDILYYDFDTIVPMLAEKYEISPDFKRITLPLRKGVYFHNGEVFDAYDVKFTWDLIWFLGAQYSSRSQANAGSIYEPNPTVIDDYTVEFSLREPNKLALKDLALANIGGILSKKFLEPHATSEDPCAVAYSEKYANGTGPYIIEKYLPGEELDFKRNRNYWAEKLGLAQFVPKVDRILLKILSSDASRMALVQRGDADLTKDVPKKDVASLSKAAGVVVSSVPISNQTTYVGMNVIPELQVYKGKNPWSDKNVRYAVTMAVPYDEIISKICFGQTSRSYGLSTLTTGSVGDKYFKQYFGDPPDLDRAKSYMDKSDWPNGFESSLYVQMDAETYLNCAEFLQATLRESLNINLSVERVTSAAFFDMLVSLKMPAYIWGFTGMLNDGAYYFFWNNNSSPGFSPTGYNPPEVADLIAKAQAETDMKKYMEYLDKIQMMTTEAADHINLYNDSLVVAYRDYVKNYMFSHTQCFEFRYFDVAK